MGDKKNIHNSLKDRLNDFNMPVNERVWKNIEDSLPPEGDDPVGGGKPNFNLLGIIVGVIAIGIVLFSILPFGKGKKSQAKEEQVIVLNENTEKNTVEQPDQTPINSTPDNSTPTAENNVSNENGSHNTTNSNNQNTATSENSATSNNTSHLGETGKGAATSANTTTNPAINTAGNDDNNSHHTDNDITAHQNDIGGNNKTNNTTSHQSNGEAAIASTTQNGINNNASGDDTKNNMLTGSPDNDNQPVASSPGNDNSPTTSTGNTDATTNIDKSTSINMLSRSDLAAKGLHTDTTKDYHTAITTTSSIPVDSLSVDSIPELSDDPLLTAEADSTTKEEKEKKASKLSIEGFVGPGISQTTNNPPDYTLDENAWANQDNAWSASSNEKMAFSFSTGLRLNYQLSDKISFSGGLQYTNHQEQQTVSTTRTAFYEVPIWGQDSTGGGTVIIGYDTEEKVVTEEKTYKNNYAFLTIPATVRYHFGKKRMHFYGEAGLQLGLLLSANQIIFDDMEGRFLQTSTKDTENHFNTLNLSFTGQYGIIYDINDKLSLTGGPSVQLFLTSVTDDVKRKPYSINFRVGIGYKF